MTRWLIPAILAGYFTMISTASAQPNVEALMKTPYKYPIHQQAGVYVITLKSYKGPEAQVLAEELADYVRNSYGLPAYLLDWGTDVREAEEKRIAELKKQHQELVKLNGQENVDPFRYKTHRMEPEFAVFIGGPKGGWKDDQTALKYLQELRKKPLPPEKLLDKIASAAPSTDKNNTKGPETNYTPLSPFTSAFVARNPTLPKAKVENDADKPDPFLKEMNAGEKYNLLKCSKPYTLTVKVYAGQTILKDRSTDTSILEKLMGNKTGAQLNASAMQAHELADFLRRMKPAYESHVLHTRYCSMVCVGDYDKPDDPQLMENQKTLANLRIGAVEQLNASIKVMQIPRP